MFRSRTKIFTDLPNYVIIVRLEQVCNSGKGKPVRKYVPAYEGNLRKHTLSVPRCISECSGIRVFGRRIKSLVFSTDVAIIKNINADAIIAVYPFLSLIHI